MKPGESYLVGSDKMMRSDSRFSDESTILKQKVDTDQLNLALSGEEGIFIGPDYRGIDVLAGYSKLDFMNTTWAILAEIDVSEAFASAYNIRNGMLVAGLFALAMLIMNVCFVVLRIAIPIVKMTGTMQSFGRRKSECGNSCYGTGRTKSARWPRR